VFFVRIIVPAQQNVTEEIALLRSEEMKEIVAVWELHVQLNKGSILTL